MIYSKFSIDVYNWDISLYSFDINRDKLKDIKSLLKVEKLPDDMYKDIISKTKTKGWGADYISDKYKRCSCIIIHNANTIEKMSELICHEMRHIQDRILKALSVEDKDEAAAYLAGYMASKVLPVLMKQKKL